MAVSMGFVHSILDFLHIRHLQPTHICDSLRGSLAKPSVLLPSSSSFSVIFLVRRKIEADEQQQIAAQYAHTRKRREFFTSAFSSCRKRGKVGAAEVGVGSEVDKAEVDDKLSDLKNCDPFLPPYSDASGSLKVIPVHYHVDSQVESYGDPGDGGQPDELSVAQESGCAVMIGVEEG